MGTRKKQINNILNNKRFRPYVRIIRDGNTITTAGGEPITQQQLQEMERDQRVNIVLREIIHTE